MISVDDYRRFVQPFIRQQCQHIDYTLYHLDGVGATHHLPALLEIEELNAIQWTPGVGEPQGGSPKWYDLYKRILQAGKSIMACWVTLDELRPLLDNIGGDGVHLEMDFHNEDEVEQALRIVEEYQSSAAVEKEVDDIIRIVENQTDADAEVQSIINKVETAFAKQSSLTTDHRSALLNPRTPKVLLLDGGMGTMIQQYQLREEDFRGARFAHHDRDLKGCNDLLSLTCPFVVRDVHRRFLEAGADVIETNTFNAQRVSMDDYGLAAYCREINLAACAIARQIADEYTAQNPMKPRFVVGSVGPTSHTCSMSTSGGQPFPTNQLHEAYLEQMEALIDGDVDAILIETIFDTLNAEVAMQAAREAMAKKGREVPLMLSFNIATPEGVNMLGQNIREFIRRIEQDDNGQMVFSVGFNCLPDVEKMRPAIMELSRSTSYRISLYPNAGKPDGKGSYSKSPQQFQADLWPLLEHHSLDIVGGCCGTTDEYVKCIAQLLEPAPGLYLTPRVHSWSKGHEPWNMDRSADQTEHSSHSAESCPCGFPHSVTDAVFDAILAGKGPAAAEATRKALEAGQSPQQIINDSMIRAMGEVGQRFQDGKAFVPQLLMAGRAMKAALELLKPLMAGTASTSLGKVVIGTVKGDLHDIGKNLVASMLEGCGFEVVNIGIDVSADTFIDEIRKNKPDILCMSALLTTTMGYMKEVIDALQEAGLRQQVKVMVGGAPVSQAFADEIGADGYSDNANTAVAVAKRLMGLAS